MAEVNNWMIDPDDAVLLLIDHQSGLFQLVKDIDLPVLRSNVTALAKVAHLAYPTIPRLRCSCVVRPASRTKQLLMPRSQWLTNLVARPTLW